MLAARAPGRCVKDDEIARSARAGLRAEDASGTIAYLHGGGWVMGNLDCVDAVCRALANERGRAWSASTTGSRPSTRSRRPRGRAAAVAGRSSAALAVAGDSAGGNLAARRRAPAARQVELPAADLPGHRRGREHAVLRRVRRGLRAHRGGDARASGTSTSTAPTASTDASPLRATTGRRPPAYVSPPATTSCATRARPTRPRSAAGVPTLERLDGTVHGFWRWQTTAIARDTVRDAAPRPSAKR